MLADYAAGHRLMHGDGCPFDVLEHHVADAKARALLLEVSDDDVRADELVPQGHGRRQRRAWQLLMLQGFPSLPKPENDRGRADLQRGLGGLLQLYVSTALGD